MLIEEGGETLLGAGEAATFKAGHADGHYLLNRSTEDAVVLEIGTRASEERCQYPDIDLVYEKRGGKVRFTNRAGEPYD